MEAMLKKVLKFILKPFIILYKKIFSDSSSETSFDCYKRKFLEKYNNPNFWPSKEYNFSNMDLSRHSYGVLNLEYIDDGILKIGQCVSIAKDVVFMLGGEHSISTLSTFPFDVFYSEAIKKSVITKTIDIKKKIKYNSITIEDDVWIGMGATILSGVHIHQGAVVGARSVVAKDVPPYAIVVGSPARVIRYRFSQKVIDKLLKYADYSKLTEEKVQEHLDLLLNTELTDGNVDLFIKLFE